MTASIEIWICNKRICLLGNSLSRVLLEQLKITQISLGVHSLEAVLRLKNLFCYPNITYYTYMYMSTEAIYERQAESI